MGYERFKGSIDGRPVEPITVRVTHVYRREDGEWKIVHRHGDNPPPDQSPPMEQPTKWALPAAPAAFGALDGIRLRERRSHHVHSHLGTDPLERPGSGTSSAANLSKKRSIPDGVKWMSIRAGSPPTFCQVCRAPRGMKMTRWARPGAAGVPACGALTGRRFGILR